MVVYVYGVGRFVCSMATINYCWLKKCVINIFKALFWRRKGSIENCYDFFFYFLAIERNKRNLIHRSFVTLYIFSSLCEKTIAIQGVYRNLGNKSGCYFGMRASIMHLWSSVLCISIENQIFNWIINTHICEHFISE